MGGTVSKLLSSEIFLLIAGSFSSHRIKFASKHNIPVVQPEFLEKLTSSPEFIDPSLYHVSPLFGNIFSSSFIDSTTLNSLKIEIEKNGGIFQDSLTSKTTHLIVADNCHSKRSIIAQNLGIPLINISQLHESITKSIPLRPIIPPFVKSSLFSSLTFRLPSQINLKIKNMILQHNGRIIEDGPADFAIECIGNGEPTRTIAWLERCIEMFEIFKISDDSLFCFTNIKHINFTGETIFLKGIFGSQYLDFVAILRSYGALIVRKLTKKTTKIILINGKCTFFEHADQWNIPIYSSDWINATISKHSIRDPKEFCLFNPNKDNQNSIPESIPIPDFCSRLQALPSQHYLESFQLNDFSQQFPEKICHQSFSKSHDNNDDQFCDEIKHEIENSTSQIFQIIHLILKF